MIEDLIRQTALLEQRLDRLTMPEIGGWRAIASTTLTGSVASVTFSSIPGVYRTLVLVTQARTDASAENDQVLWRANADAGNNYDRLYGYFRGDNNQISGMAIATSAGYGPGTEAANSRASNFAPGLVYFPGYTLTNREKWSQVPVFTYFGDVSASTDMYAGIEVSRWRNTSAITSIVVLPNTGPNFVADSTFQLYGIL